MLLPSLDFVLHFRQVIDSSIKALVDKHVEFDLSHVEPTAVSGRVDKLKPIQQRFGLRRIKCLVKRSRAVSIQIVHYECDLLSIGILLGNSSQKMCPVRFGSPLGD